MAIQCNKCGKTSPSGTAHCVYCGVSLPKVEEKTPETVSMGAVATTYPTGYFFSSVMRFLLCVVSIFLPILAFIFGLLVSLTPYPDKDEVAERTLRWSSIAFIVQLILGLIVGFISAIV